MNESIDTISKAWPVIVSLFGLIAWLVRIESNVSMFHEKIGRLQAQHDILNSEVMKKISEMSDKLSRIEGAMAVHK